MLQSTAPLQLRTLGELRLEGAERGFSSPRKSLVLLAYLGRASARGVRREELTALLWGDRPEARARQSLRQVLLELRHVLGDALDVGPELVQLKPGAIQVDAVEFERDIAAGRWAEAVRRWGGDFLMGAEDAGGERFRVWLEEQREALRRKLGSAFERLLDAAEQAGSWPEAARWADAWTAAAPHDERAHTRLVTALEAAGQREEALARHASFLVRLRGDLELEPSPELVRIGERLSRAGTGWRSVNHVSAAAALEDAWHGVLAGEARVVWLRGQSTVRARLCEEFLRSAERPPAGPLVLHAIGSAGEPWATARVLLAALRHAPGLSGAPDAALAELCLLVPGIRDRFPRLPAPSGGTNGLMAATAQVLRDVAAEVNIVLCVHDVGAADAETRALLNSLASEDLPGVLLVLGDDGALVDPAQERGTMARAGAVRLTLMSDAPPAPAPVAAETASPAWTDGGRRARRRRVASLVAAPLILGAVLVVALRGRPPSAPAAPNRVAVFPFALHGNEAYSYLREGLAELLSTSIDGIGAWRAVDARSVMRQTASIQGALDARRAGALGEKLGSDLVILGSITESGGLLRVQAALYRRSETEPLTRATAEGTADNLFGLVDVLASQILGQEDDSPGGRLGRVAARTTDSLAALKAYLQGESLLRRFHVREAFDAYRRAVTIDSTFALAWYGQAMAATWLLAPDPALRAIATASRHADRLSWRDRAIVETFYAYMAGRSQEAELLARSVLAHYPDDLELRMHLAETLFHSAWRRGGTRAEAEPELRRVLESEPTHWPAMLHLAQLLLHAGRAAEADTLLASLVAVYGESPAAASIAALRAAASADDHTVDARLRALRDAGDWWLTSALWDLAMYSPAAGAADRAALLLADSARSPAARALGHLARAHGELARGRWHNARAELALVEPLHREWFHEYSALLAAAPFLPGTLAEYELQHKRLLAWQADSAAAPARPPDPQPWTTVHDRRHGLIRLYLLAQHELRLGRFGDAAERVAMLEAQSAGEATPAMARGLAGGVRAQILRLEGRTDEALAILEATSLEAPFEYWMASSFWSQPLERFLRAELLAEARRYDEALGLLRGFDLTSPFDAVYRAPAALKTAEIHEQRGEFASAVVAYQKFIELWRDSDPELRPLVVEAQRRIEKLRGRAGA